MIVYFSFFAISIFLYMWCVLLKNIGFNHMAILPELLSGAFMGMVAGVRDLTVGTDVLFYMEPSFKYASLYPTFIDYWRVYHFEFLYAFLSYYIDKYTNNVTVFFFTLMGITIFFVFLFINNNFKDISPIFAFILFLFSFFNLALNYSRQMVAVAILLYAYIFLKKNQNFRFIVFVGIAFFFHATAILGLVILPLYYFYKLKVRTRFLANLVGIFIFSLILVFYNKILLLLINHQWINSKYIVHLTSGIDIQVVNIFFHFIIIIICLFMINHASLKPKETLFFNEVCLLDFCLLMVSFFSDTAYRIELYSFAYLTILILPRCVKTLKVNKSSQLFWKIIVFLLFIVYWYITIFVQNIGQTNPYTSAIFKIQ